jgi:signal transduction histidine kinase
MLASIDIAQDNAHFQHIFRRMLMGFLGFVFIYLTTSTSLILSNTPAYLHDWRGIACIVLTLVAFVIYAVSVLIPNQKWPPPLYYSLSLWLSLYLVTTLLSFIDHAFLWDFYLAIGISYSLFQSRRLVLVIIIVVITMFAFQGLLTWPMEANALWSLIGQAMGFFSLTAISMLLQRLIRERYERNQLLQQLTQTNAELEAAHHQLAQSVEQEQELAVLRERTRLAREMHDTLGHTLVLIAVKLEAAQRLRERDPERCGRELESTKEIAREAMTTLRASIANLRSPALEREHIYRALGRSARELAKRTGLQVTYTLQPDIEAASERLPEIIEETLWKVSQEAFTNIEKHAHASHVYMSISRHDGKLLISIQDDGIGLPQALSQPHENGSLLYNSPSSHYGLNGMRERVESVGGHLSLHSSKDQGTTVELELPLIHSNLVEDVCSDN